MRIKEQKFFPDFKIKEAALSIWEKGFKNYSIIF